MATANPIPDYFTEKHAANFWKHVNKEAGQGPNGDCWEWTRRLNAEGYGRFDVAGIKPLRQFRTHRLSYYLCYGINPETLHVLHKCDNRKCVNPEHLFLGDAKANRQDCVQKGRHAKGRKIAHPSKIGLYPQRVKAIRNAHRFGMSQRQLAIIAGIEVRTMGLIINRHIWDYPDCG